jgi:hypothetical protein
LPYDGDLTVAELCVAYWRWAKRHYRVKPGEPRGLVERARLALRALRQDYGHTLAEDFGPLALRSLQRQLAESGKSRSYVNGLIQVIKQSFKWAVAQEMLSVTVFQALATVPGLKKGRDPARGESEAEAQEEGGGPGVDFLSHGGKRVSGAPFD